MRAAKSKMTVGALRKVVSGTRGGISIAYGKTAREHQQRLTNFLEYHLGPCMDELNTFATTSGLFTKFYFQIPECIRLKGCLNVPGAALSVVPGTCEANGSFQDGVDHYIPGTTTRVCVTCDYAYQSRQFSGNNANDIFSGASAMNLQTVVCRYCMQP